MDWIAIFPRNNELRKLFFGYLAILIKLPKPNHQMEKYAPHTDNEFVCCFTDLVKAGLINFGGFNLVRIENTFFFRNYIQRVASYVWFFFLLPDRNYEKERKRKTYGTTTKRIKNFSHFDVFRL